MKGVPRKEREEVKGALFIYNDDVSGRDTVELEENFFP